MTKIRLIIIYLFIISSVDSFGQHCDLSPGGVTISHVPPKGNWMLNYTFMEMQMGQNYSGSVAIDNSTIFNTYLMAGKNMKMDMHMVMAMYGISDRLSLMIHFNYQDNSMQMEQFNGSTHIHNHSSSDMNYSANNSKMSTSGIGDSKITAIYKFKISDHSSILAGLGGNIPTGNYRIRGNPHGISENERFPYIMQTGTGSVDFTPSITYLNSNNKIAWSVQLMATIRPFKNSVGYHYGNEFNLNAWMSYRIASFLTSSIRMEDISCTNLTGKDQTIYSLNEPSSDYRNYGGNKLSSYFGINIFLNSGILSESKLAFEYGIPIFQTYYGIQQKTKQAFILGYTKSF